MKLALVSPLPPTPSGIADYAAELLPHLARDAEVTLLVDEPAQVDPELARRHAVHATGDLAFLLARGDVELPVYMVGNGPAHARALRGVRTHPGLLVLHDPVLHHLLAHLTIENGWREQYRELLVQEFGEQARDWPERIQDRNEDPWRLYRIYYRLPFSRALARGSRGVVVHSEHARRRLGALGDVPVEVVPHGADPVQFDRAAARRQLGLVADHFAVGLVGGLGRNRLTAQALEAFAMLARQAPQAVLLIADAEQAETRRQLVELGIAAQARFLGRPGFAEYLANLGALDAALALRFPTCGETSGTAIRLMSVGVPFVTTDVDAYRELPDAACVKLRPDRELVERAAATLLDWAQTRPRPAARPVPMAETAARLLAFARRVRTGVVPASVSAEQSRAVPRVEAVVISYNGRKFIGPALQSLLEQDHPALRVTVVDNASSDGSAEWIRQEYPTVRVVASSRNLGFAAGNNLAFAQSDADWFFLLNQDAVARRDAISELLEVATRRDDIAAVAAKMLMQRSPTILNSAGIRINEAAWAVDRRIGEKDSDPSPLPENVFGACGGAVLLRRQALAECGAFDARFFMYFEDVDLCWRLRLAGWQVWYAPAAVVLHDWHGDRGAGDRAARRRFLCERNRWLCLFRNAGLKSIVRLWPQLRAYDRERLATVRREIARGHDVEYFTMVGNAIRRAWRWNLLHLPRTWWSRLRTQRLRRRSDGELRRWIEPGVTEPSHVGDLTAIRDRFTAVAVPELVMGRTDRDALGPGWHPLEGDPGAAQWRWTKERAWFYLCPAQDCDRVRVRVGGRPQPGNVLLELDGERAPAAWHDGRGDIWLEFHSPRLLRAGTVIEGCLLPDTFVPADLGLGPDHRVLGIPVLEIRTGTPGL